MPDHSHPYTNLPKQAFWKTAVAELDCRQIDLAWKPKAPVSRETKIITVGSCFAQHISKSLKENGFSWLDSEPAPAALPPAEHARHGYGVFSFRTGNIYTAALLKQWIMWATGKAGQSKESFQNDGRYFDPFRPSLTAEGFSSAEEMLAARQITLAAMLDAIKQADLFIFTLGLTEAWLNQDGSIYPMCPGTIRGQFSPEHHLFHNYDHQEVVRDLTGGFDELRRINPNLRFLLTVSPVPLTATASGQHVLTATTYSKSVLRSAAGYLTQTREDTDYFPSYELITAPVFKGQFFEQNMRSVSPEGVAFVMGQFLGAIGSEQKSAAPEISVGTKAIDLTDFEKTESGNDICDDIILETWSNKPADDAEEPPNILLIGDSQMGMIAKVLDEQGIRYAGGAIMHGAEWDAVKFIDNEERIFSPLDSDAKARWEDAFDRSFCAEGIRTNHTLHILCNIGAHSHRLLEAQTGLPAYFLKRNRPFPNVIDIADFLDFLRIVRGPHINLVSKLVQLGHHVIWLTDPPFQHGNALAIFSAFDMLMQRTMEQVGCSVFNARDWAQSMGGARSEFRSSDAKDWIHGSDEYYRQITTEIFHRFSIKPQYHLAAPKTSIGTQSVASGNDGKAESATDICDDIILETWSNKPADDAEEPPNILLIGDSQMGMIAKILDEQGIRYAGGAIMHGSEWHNCNFQCDETKYFLPNDADARERWLYTLTESLSRGSLASNVTIITNIGAHSFQIFGEEFEEYLRKISPVRFSNTISDSNLLSFLTLVRQPHLDVVKRFADAGYKVVWVCDPPFQPNPADIFGRMDKVLTDRFLGIGCLVFHTRNWLRNFGHIPPEFISSEINPATGQLDWVHGSPEYYRQLTKEIFTRFSIKPHYRHRDNGAATAAASNGATKTESETDICDDIILETWSNKPADDAEEPPNILLIGDSQMGMIAKVLDEQGIRYAGGAIMHGSEWHGLKFTLLDDLPYFVPTIPEARLRWGKACEQSLSKIPKSARNNLWIITNIGYHANDLATPDGFERYLQNKHGVNSRNGQTLTASIEDLHHYLLSSRESHLDLVNQFRKAGFKTIWVSDPPVNQRNAELTGAAEQILSKEFRAIGCLTFLAGKWINDRYGTLPAKFLSGEIDPSTGQPDVVHGSPEYYRQLVKEIFSAFQIRPQLRHSA